ncbi:MAG: YqhG family protein [Bacilli bacterium]
MKQSEILDYLIRFFTANGCAITQHNRTDFSVLLTVAMDKELMNRPFYWHYLEKTNGTPKPATLSFTTKTDHQYSPTDSVEYVHFGSPRLHAIFQKTLQLGRCTSMYEDTKSQSPQGLEPWMCCNFKVSYECTVKKDEWYSLGVHLISGRILHHFHSHLEQKLLTLKIPDLSFCVMPLLTPHSAIQRLEQLVMDKIQSDSHEWAATALLARDKEEALLRAFYPEDNNEVSEQWITEKDEIYKRHTPYVTVDIVNGGLFYLHPTWHKQLTDDCFVYELTADDSATQLAL